MVVSDGGSNFIEIEFKRTGFDVDETNKTGELCVVQL